MIYKPYHHQRQLDRLRRAEEQLSLAATSGHLRDRPYERGEEVPSVLVRAALVLVKMARAGQQRRTSAE